MARFSVPQYVQLTTRVCVEYSIAASEVPYQEPPAEPCLTVRLTWAGSVVVGSRYAEARTSAAAVNAARWSGGVKVHLLSGYAVPLKEARPRARVCSLPCGVNLVGRPSVGVVEHFDRRCYCVVLTGPRRADRAPFEGLFRTGRVF